MTETTWSTKPKIFTLYPLKKKNVVNPNADDFRGILEIGFRVGPKAFGCYIMEGGIPKGKSLS